MMIWDNIRKPRLRVHHKLGLTMFVMVVFFLLILEIVFYSVFTRFYVQQLADDMVHRGHSHASALQINWSEEMLQHVAEMESYSRYTVVVIDVSGEVLASSKPLETIQSNFLRSYESRLEYEWVEKDWRHQPYLISQSPIIIGNVEVVGHIIMFTSTTPIREALQSFQVLLLFFTIISVLSVFFFVFLFSNWFSKPLIGMKNAIHKLSRNDYDFALPKTSDDEIGELNRSILELSAELKHYRTERQEFLAEISHELRTPITYIRGYAEVLKSQILKDEEKNKYLQFIYDAADRLNQLIGDLYEMTKLDQVQVQIHKNEVDLVELIRQIAEEIVNPFEASGILLKAELPEVSVTVYADRYRIVQAIMNILENARKYTPKGNHVSLRLTFDKKEAYIEVRDTGIGIPDEELPHIWRRFYRVEKSRSRNYGGSGLGLSIARKIVELHGGTIEAFSKEGEGTTFLIRLPIS